MSSIEIEDGNVSVTVENDDFLEMLADECAQQRKKLVSSPGDLEDRSRIRQIMLQLKVFVASQFLQRHREEYGIQHSPILPH